MTASETFVIVGAGLAGAKAAEALRAQGFDGPLVLLGDEPYRPYERPPLSKTYLAGAAERDSVFVHEPDWYARNRVSLRLDTAVTSIDRAATRYDSPAVTLSATPSCCRYGRPDEIGSAAKKVMTAP